MGAKWRAPRLVKACIDPSSSMSSASVIARAAASPCARPRYRAPATEQGETSSTVKSTCSDHIQKAVATAWCASVCRNWRSPNSSENRFCSAISASAAATSARTTRRAVSSWSSKSTLPGNSPSASSAARSIVRPASSCCASVIFFVLSSIFFPLKSRLRQDAEPIIPADSAQETREAAEFRRWQASPEVAPWSLVLCFRFAFIAPLSLLTKMSSSIASLNLCKFGITFVMHSMHKTSGSPAPLVPLKRHRISCSSSCVLLYLPTFLFVSSSKTFSTAPQWSHWRMYPFQSSVVPSSFRYGISILNA